MNFDWRTRLLTAVILVLVTSSTMAAPPTVPSTMSYQGRLTDPAGQPVRDGGYPCVFSIWSDSTGGDLLWTSDKVEIVTASGLFSVILGQAPMMALDPAIFSAPNRWLGIAVESQTEMTPRTRLTSVPYAFRADQANSVASAPGYLPLSGGTMTGTTLHDGVASQWQSGGTDRVVVDPNNRMIQMNGSDGAGRVILREAGAGELQLADSSSTTYGGAYLSGGKLGGGGSGGNLMLFNSAGSVNTWLDASVTGDSSVILPDNAIDSREILDEPGIASNYNPNGIYVSTTMQDIVTVTITIPAPGYIELQGQIRRLWLIGTIGANGVFLQIDETAGGFTLPAYCSEVLIAGSVDLSPNHYSPTCTRIYYEPVAGSYTFRLESRLNAPLGAGASVYAQHSILTATYYPTSYGSVVALVPPGEAGRFDNAEAVSVPTGPGAEGSSETMYQVDLRDLELRAAKATAEAERLKRELAEAKMNKMRQQQAQGMSDKQ